jgi:hypothetical protein
MLLAFERSATSERFVSLGNFLDRGARLRMRAQFFLFSFGVFTANALLDLLSNNVLLIWEGALLTSCYNLSIIKLASYNGYPRRPERTRKRRADDRQHRGFRTLIITVVFLFGLCRKIWLIHFRAYPLPPANLSQ